MSGRNPVASAWLTSVSGEILTAVPPSLSNLREEATHPVEVLPETDRPSPVVAGVGLRATVDSRGPDPAYGVADVLRGNPPKNFTGLLPSA